MSKSWRVGRRPPPPPCGTAFSPKWRRPTTNISAVAVVTPYGRRRIIASSRPTLGFGASSSRPSSTAASATSLPRGSGAPVAVRTLMRASARSRTRYTVRSVETETRSSWARQPTRISAMPSLWAGRPRSTSAVGCVPPTRPRTTSAETNTLGAC